MKKMDFSICNIYIYITHILMFKLKYFFKKLNIEIQIRDRKIISNMVYFHLLFVH